MAKAGDMSSDINFLFEMGNLRLIKRLGYRFGEVFQANVAEHHFRMFWIAMVIAAREKGADMNKIAKMVMVHDITESRTGDTDYISRQYVVRNEELAIKDILQDSSLEKEFRNIWEEYQKRESLEAKIVKDADNLDVDFELTEQAANGHSLPEQWKAIRKSSIRDVFYTKTAQKMFDDLQKSNPHAWHLQGRNRIKDGDWKR